MEPTHEPELTEPVDLCAPDGRTLNPAARGWSRRPLHRINLAGRRFRTKRWDYWAVLAGDLALGLVYADVGYLGIASIWWADLSTGDSGGRDVARPLARDIELPDQPGTAPLRYESDDLTMDLTDTEVGTQIAVDWTERDGTRSEVDVVVERLDGHESLSVVIPWSDTHFQFTTKDQARRARGILRRGERISSIGEDSDAWGVLDVGRGRWPYAITWNWGGGAGHADTGELVGIQLGGRWTAGTGFTENAVTIDGRLHKISRELTWHYDWGEPMRPWRVVDEASALDLTLRPRFDKHSGTNALVLRTEVHQVFGTWTGTVVSDDGRELHLDGVLGFAEESRNRW